jgi:hypothetical protein
MPTPRQYQFDVDTKRYLNRVNTYRSLNGLADIQKPDAVDIDNFVIGLKDLGIWSNTLCFLTRSTQNVGTGNVFYPIGGAASVNVGEIFTGAGPTASTWTTNGIKQNVSTSSGTNFIGLFSNLSNNPQTEKYTMFGCLDVNNNGFWGFGAQNLGGGSYTDSTPRAFTVANSRRVRLQLASNYDITTTESYSEGQFFLMFAFLSTTQAIVKSNNFNGIVANGNYFLPQLRQITFGTNASFFLNYGNLVTQAMFGVVYHTNIANETGSSFYTLYKDTVGKGLNAL